MTFYFIFLSAVTIYISFAGNMFLISANDMNMSMNSIITLLDWDSFEMHHNDNLNLEVLSFLSNLAAYSVNMRDNLLGTGIITKIEEYIFDGDCKKVRID